MMYAMFANCSTLILVLAVPRAAEARRRLIRLFRTQEEWAEMLDRNAQPRQECPWRGPRDGDDESIDLPAENPALAVLPSGRPDGRRRA